jgi:K+-sensing histidine kinase KdpD
MYSHGSPRSTSGNQIGVSDTSNDGRDPFGAITAVAHELRTPLTAIQGAVEILRDEAAGVLNPAQREFVDLAHRNLARLKDRIEDALDIASVRGGSAPEPAAVRLNSLAGCVAKRAAVELGLQLQVRFEGFSGEHWLEIEDRSLCRILASIVGTVGRHLGMGNVLVRAALEQSRIRFEIAAEGPAGQKCVYTTIHDASLALACEMVELYGGTAAGLDAGCCGVYVLLPLRPICTEGERP